MKILPVLLFVQLFLLSIPMFSQENEKLNEVYLNDGSFVRGEIIEKVENQYIRMKISGGNTVQFSMSEIKKIKTQKKGYHYFSNGNKVKTNGLYFSIFGGMNFGKNDYENIYGKSFSLSTGYHFNKHFGLGAGVGFDNYDPEALSAFINARYAPWRRKVTPYFSGKIGYGLPLDLYRDHNIQDYKGGLLLNPAIGFQFSSRSNSSLLLEVGYNFQKMTRSNEWRETVDHLVFRRLCVTIGIQF